MSRSDGLSRFDVSELLERPGRRRELSGSRELDDLESSTAQATRVDYDLEAEAIGSQVVLAGAVVTSWTSGCRRCLEPVSGQSETQLREIFEVSPTEGETYPIADNHIDVAAMLDEAVLLALPLAPLCGSECSGPAPARFPTGAGAPAEEERVPDPRWSALDDLTFE